MDLFTIRNGASLELVRATLYGDNRKFVIPDNANNTSLTTKYVDFKIVNGDVPGTEIQILRRTVEGIGILGAVLWSQLAKADAVVLDISPCLIP